MKVEIEIDYDQAENIVVEALKESLRLIEEHGEGSYVLRDSLHRVIAYYSVPGEYEGGVYDDTSDCDVDYVLTHGDTLEIGNTSFTITSD